MSYIDEELKIDIGEEEEAEDENLEKDLNDPIDDDLLEDDDPMVDEFVGLTDAEY